MRVNGSFFPEERDKPHVWTCRDSHTLDLGSISLHFSTPQALEEVSEAIRRYLTALREEALSETHNAT